MLDEQSLTESPVTVRVAQPADIPAITQLDAFSTSPPRDIHRDLEKYFGSTDPTLHERNVILLAELSDQIVGKAELVLPPQGAPPVGYIRRVVVRPDYRGYGIGRRVVQAALRLAADAGMQFVDLHVWEGNIPAIRLYESLGFKEQHREIYYRLALNPSPQDAILNSGQEESATDWRQKHD
jgi:ribosomal protein S18 acetylase RimI-like enzyme